MFREDIGGYSQPPRPQCKKTPWVPVLCAILAGSGIAHVAGLTKPLATIARQLTGIGRTPGYRLVGDWESVDDPMFQRICYVGPKGNKGGTGFYMADATRGKTQVLFKVESEDRSGRHVEMAEFRFGVEENYRVRYTVAGDGRSMTREYDDRYGNHVSAQYRYIGPPTEEPPPIYDAGSMPR